MIYQDCKYRMPCGWCDRHNRLCDIVQHEINKKNEKENMRVQCVHNWELKAFEPTDYTNEIGKRYYNEKYVCRNCGEEEYRMSTSH